MSDFLHPTDARAAPPGTLVASGDRELRLDLMLVGDPSSHRDLLRDLLMQQGWEVSWNPAGWSGQATKGSKVKNVLFGAFAQYHEFVFSFSTRQDGATCLSVYRTGDGCFGGLYGMYKVKKSFKATSSLVEGHFAAGGHLLTSSGH